MMCAGGDDDWGKARKEKYRACHQHRHLDLLLAREQTRGWVGPPWPRIVVDSGVLVAVAETMFLKGVVGLQRQSRIVSFPSSCEKLDHLEKRKTSAKKVMEGVCQQGDNFFFFLDLEHQQ